MFDPERRLAEEVAKATQKNAPAKLLTADEIARWAKRRYEEMSLLLDEDGRGVPLSPAQIERAVGLVVEWRQREL